MNIKFKRKNNLLFMSIEGRLDAFEASALSKELETLLTEDDSYLVLDMVKVPYLSSGGLRVLLAAQKKLARRNGWVCLCGLSGYPLQVIKMSGMDIIFAFYSTTEEAFNQILIRENMKRAEKDIWQLPCYKRNQTSFHIFSATDKGATLKIVGDLMKVLHATLERKDIRQRRFSETEYSIGLGALGGSLEDCMPLLGEMMTIGGSMVWLPTDGNDTPDYLIPQKDTGEVMIHTGLNLALEGDFCDVILVGGVDQSSPITLGELYEAIFDIAKERKLPHSSLASMAMVADLDGLFSSGVKIAPIKKFAPAEGGLITDPENVTQWMDINTESKYSSNTMLSFGIGLDLTSDLAGLSKTALDNIFYLHPANIGSNKMLLHNHGVVFKNVKWQYALNLDTEIRRIVRHGDFIDMRHLLDTTRITRAIAGVSYISDIRVESDRNLGGSR